MSRDDTFIHGLPGNEVIHFRYNGKMDCIFLRDILYIESDRVYSNIYLIENKERPKKICKTLQYFDKQLREKGFIRCHRFYIINLRHVEFFCSYQKSINIKGITIKVSRRAAFTVFKTLLENGYKEK